MKLKFVDIDGKGYRKEIESLIEQMLFIYEIIENDEGEHNYDCRTFNSSDIDEGFLKIRNTINQICKDRHID